MEVRSADNSCEWEPLCATCLSSGRRLAPLGGLRRVFAILMKCDPSAKLKDLAICWECAAVLRRTSQFRLQASRARVCLQSANEVVKFTSSLRPIGPTALVDILPESVLYESDSEMPQEIKTPKTEYESDEIDTDKLILEHIDEKPEIKSTPHLEVLSAGRNKFKRTKHSGRKVKKTNTLKSSYKKRTCRSRIMRLIDLNESEVFDYREQKRNRPSFKLTKYKCDICLLRLNRHNHAKHMQSAHGLPSYKYECHICAIRFKTNILLQKHICGHFQMYRCLKCKYMCNRMDNMNKHYHKEHLLKKSYSCSFCGIKLYDWYEYLEHKKRHKMEDMNKIYECDYCGKQYKKRPTIERHLTTHSQKSYECDVCAHSFTRKCYLIRHFRFHHEVAPEPSEVYCVECDKQFTTICAYKVHINNVQAHAISKPIKIPCTACEKTFVNDSSLKRHYDFIHLHKILFPCKMCDKGYNRKLSLKEHIKRFHEQVPHPKDKMCTICGRGFSTNRILTNHIRTHTGERPYQCEMCAAAFTQRTPLLYHVKRVHPRIENAKTVFSSG